MKMKKFLALLVALLLLCGGMTACGEEDDADQNVDNTPKQNALTSAYADKDYGFQLEAPQEGETVAAYEQVGGTPHLDFRHTVFGQVYAGMEVVDAIAGVATNPNDKPLEDVVILSIDVKDYE